MKTKFLFPFVAAAVLTGCKPESKYCSQMVEVPFVSVSIPDSVPARGTFVIDAQLHDMGCYQATDMRARVHRDTIFLVALADYDECGCPEKSNGLEIELPATIDTASPNTTKYFVYWQINSTKDSISYRCDSIYFY